jgi:NAD(P)-dependent dehydrogenase (short-subunit alcohol dehydrogenase family)
MNTPQRPIGSGFGAASAAEQVIREIDLTGKTAIVTGGYSGLGVETVRVLRKAGARVIAPARDVERARKALAHIPGVEVEAMDLLDPTSIDNFAAEFHASGSPLHILINSAGIMATPLTRDARGFESQFATNHLGHFQLTKRLLPALRKAKGARVVSVSSAGHRFSPVDFADPQFEHREYTPFSAYGQSKTANILFAVELDAREKGNGIRAFAVHPGGIFNTGLAKHLPRQQFVDMGVMDAAGNPIIDPSRNLKTIEQGAATQVWCATSPKLNGMGGVYCENSDIASPSQQKPETQPGASRAFVGVLPYAIDATSAKRLWEMSERLLGLEQPAQATT